MIINGLSLLQAAPIKDMATQKHRDHGVSWGLGEAGYDIRIKQDIKFIPPNPLKALEIEKVILINQEDQQFLFHIEREFDNYFFGSIFVDDQETHGRFTIASAIEEFDMPTNLVGIVHDKSSWARKGLSVFNTVIEPGWKGFLTLELVFHGSESVHIPAGAAIAQVVFHQTSDLAQYQGKYQNQEDKPVESING